MDERTFRTRRVPLVVLIAAVVGLLLAGLALASGDHARGLTVRAERVADGPGRPTATVADSRPAPGPRPAPIIHRPSNLSRAAAVPLVIALHPSGSSPAGFEAQSGLDRVADARGFVVAYLGSPTPTPMWRLADMPRNLAYVSSEIGSLTVSEHIDPTRVYVTGFSAGATMSYFVGCQLSAQVDGIAPVSGAMRFADPCSVSHPVSELEVIGTTDAIPINGSPVLLSAAQIAARWRAFDGCAGAPSASTAGLVSQQAWNQCNDASGVDEYVIQGGKHVWPSPRVTGPDGQLDAAQAIWSFFAQHPGTSPTIASARLASLRVRGGPARELRATLSTGDPARVRLRLLTRAGRQLAAKNFNVARTASVDLRLPVPRRIGRGRYSVSVELTDSYGRRLTIVRSVRLPRPPKTKK